MPEQSPSTQSWLAVERAEEHVQAILAPYSSALSPANIAEQAVAAVIRDVHEALRLRLGQVPIHTVVEQHRPRAVAERNTKPIPRTFDAVGLDGVWDILDDLLNEVA